MKTITESTVPNAAVTSTSANQPTASTENFCEKSKNILALKRMAYHCIEEEDDHFQDELHVTFNHLLPRRPKTVKTSQDSTLLILNGTFSVFD